MPETPRAADALARELGIPVLAAQLLCNRGFSDPAEARAFLYPSLAELPGPEGFDGMEQAVDLLCEAVREGRTIGVAGDYDADGVTATALMVDFLQKSQARVVWDLPHRLNEGYGFLPPRADRLKEAGAEVVITVDCGISDHEGVARSRELGMRVVVTDHHQLPPGAVVPADAVVNPQQGDDALARNLAGVGVSFYLAAALRASLRARGHYNSTVPEPNLRNSLDLVALGTCADVVPLVGHNRILVNEGLRVLNEGGRLGLRALSRAAGVRGALDSRDLGFGLAPRINAAGRVDHPDQALRLLLADREDIARDLAGLLNGFNEARRGIEEEMFGQAMDQVIGDDGLDHRGMLVLSQEGWHKGVLGIVASRVVEATGKPAILFAVENGKAVGSGRSVQGFHLQQALTKCAHLMQHYGGHAMAAGMTAATADLGQLSAELDKLAKRKLAEALGNDSLEVEALATLDDLGPRFMGFMDCLGPYGEGNPEPLLSARDVRVVRAWEVGKGHLRMNVAQGRMQIPAIWFGHINDCPPDNCRCDLVFHPRISNFRGRRLELVVQDMKTASV